MPGNMEATASGPKITKLAGAGGVQKTLIEKKRVTKERKGGGGGITLIKGQ